MTKTSHIHCCDYRDDVRVLTQDEFDWRRLLVRRDQHGVYRVHLAQEMVWQGYACCPADAEIRAAQAHLREQSRQALGLGQPVNLKSTCPALVPKT